MFERPAYCKALAVPGTPSAPGTVLHSRSCVLNSPAAILPGPTHCSGCCFLKGGLSQIGPARAIRTLPALAGKLYYYIVRAQFAAVRPPRGTAVSSEGAPKQAPA